MANGLTIEFDDEAAQTAVDHWKQIVGSGAEDAVDQLGTLAEASMKDEAPEGVGIPEVNLRTTIKSRKVSADPYKRVIQPTKKTQDGWPLHHAIIEGSDYTSAPPPLEPILAWAEAKITPRDGGSFREAAQAIRWNIYHDGHETFPNPFVDRSMNDWETRVDQVASDAVEQAFDTGGAL